MKCYHVYILKCKDESYYTGVTNNLERRLYEHETGYNPTSYTHNKRPLKLLFCEDFLDINHAIAFEKQLKGWSRKKKEAIIEGKWEKLKELSVCKNNSSASTPLSMTTANVTLSEDEGMSP